jgi:glutaconate CoA-transferase subunit A
MTGRVAPIHEAVELVHDGSHIALTGFAITRNNIAVSHALIRAGKRRLHLCQVVGGMETDLLAGAGCLQSLTYSGGSLDRFGPLHAVNRAIGDGSLEVAEYSSLALTLRLHAAGLGLPYVPAHSMLGSDLLEPLLLTGDVRMGEDPFGGGAVALLSALQPEVAFVHADVADAHGNASVSGPTWALRETAFAAQTVIIVCEQLVPTGSIDPNRVTIPSAIVDVVTVVPHGAHPTAVHGCYDYDRSHLQKYADAGRHGVATHAAYIQEFVLGVDDHSLYLSAVGGSP